MGELNLIQIAKELLAIHEEFPYHLKNYDDSSIRDFVMETFSYGVIQVEVLKA